MKRSFDISMTRLPVLRRERTAYSFACPGCNNILGDGSDYSWCPECELTVDRIDLSMPVWACRTCDFMVNAWKRSGCKDCIKRLRQLIWPASEEKAQERQRAFDFVDLLSWIPSAVAIALVAFLVVLAFDPKNRAMALALTAPIWLIPVVVYGARLGTLLAAMGSVFGLVRNRRRRVMHGLEHATIALLEAQLGIKDLGGLALVDGFEITVGTETASLVCQQTIQEATVEAMGRVKAGETELTLSPQCGTSLFVAALLQSIWVTALALAALFTIASAKVVLTGAGVVLVGSLLFRKRLGLLAQRYLTVSTEFERARVLNVNRRPRSDGQGIVFEIEVDLELAASGSGSRDVDRVGVDPGVLALGMFGPEIS